MRGSLLAIKWSKEQTKSSLLSIWKLSYVCIHERAMWDGFYRDIRKSLTFLSEVILVFLPVLYLILQLPFVFSILYCIAHDRGANFKWYADNSKMIIILIFWYWDFPLKNAVLSRCYLHISWKILAYFSNTIKYIRKNFLNQDHDNPRRK